jgi:hypothetical protein
VTQGPSAGIAHTRSTAGAEVVLAAIAVLATVTRAQTLADSPLTITDFASCYLNVKDDYLQQLIERTPLALPMKAR